MLWLFCYGINKSYQRKSPFIAKRSSGLYISAAFVLVMLIWSYLLSFYQIQQFCSAIPRRRFLSPAKPISTFVCQAVTNSLCYSYCLFNIAKCSLFSAPQVFIIPLLCKLFVCLYTKFQTLLTVGPVCCCAARCQFHYNIDTLSIIILPEGLSNIFA